MIVELVVRCQFLTLPLVICPCSSARGKCPESDDLASCRQGEDCVAQRAAYQVEAMKTQIARVIGDFLTFGLRVARGPSHEAAGGQSARSKFQYGGSSLQLAYIGFLPHVRKHW